MSDLSPGSTTTSTSPTGSQSTKSPPEPIGVDPAFQGTEGDDGEDSDIFDEVDTRSTFSVPEYISQFRRLHGRTYHNYQGAEYWGPNDDRQNEGLDVAHHMMNVAMDGKLFLAPLNNPQKVLDVGTGTGIWAIDFADEHPGAIVIGTDISPIQPALVPSNCSFEIDNCELPWTYRDNTFDYIHIRGLVGCVRDWPGLYAECLRTLKPGGWLEQQEYALPIAGNETPLPEDCVWHDWARIFRDAGARTRRSFDVTDHWHGWLREAGFTGRLHTDCIRLPIGGWAASAKWKQVGLLNSLSLEEGLDGFASYLCTAVLGWSEVEIELVLARVRSAIKNKAYHAFYPLQTIYIQKPPV
ncbi:S-adenosyl-L-methionine-dependent methyltransferase [Plectosphaerella plurivora]|uniref:S-adenosyl-L-methionine-dependent methyltransferase n=1 Tax=Plectosphaerella plurivora TaxID=936078 RepID=A0A9P8VFT0_9PEZI|nr:S-adenosyl-L-methionine-dependent methyltransferase [Plectosphaerella plurivora]